MSRIRAAKDWGKRPTAAIMMDDAFGHRDPFTGIPKGDVNAWIYWDHLLANVHQLIVDFTDDNGFLAWEKDDPSEAMEILASARQDRAEATKTRFETSAQKILSRPGYYVEMRMKLRKGREYPSHKEYFENLAERFK